MSSREASKIITIMCPVLSALANIIFLVILIMVLANSHVKHFTMVQKTVKLRHVNLFIRSFIHLFLRFQHVLRMKIFLEMCLKSLGSFQLINFSQNS